MRRILNYLREVNWYTVGGVALLAVAIVIGVLVGVFNLPAFAALGAIVALAGLGFIQIGLRS